MTDTPEKETNRHLSENQDTAPEFIDTNDVIHAIDAIPEPQEENLRSRLKPLNSGSEPPPEYESVLITSDTPHFQAVFEAKLRLVLADRNKILQDRTPVFSLESLLNSLPDKENDQSPLAPPGSDHNRYEPYFIHRESGVRHRLSAEPEPENLFVDDYDEVEAGYISEDMANGQSDFESQTSELTDQFEKGAIRRIHLKSDRLLLLEELYQLWSMGYRHPDLPLLFIHYFASLETENGKNKPSQDVAGSHPRWKKVILEMLTYREIKEEERVVADFLYGDITGSEMNMSDFLEAYSKLEPLPTIDFSLEIVSNDSLIDRRRFSQWNRQLQSLFDREFDKDLVRFFARPLKKHASTFLSFHLMKRWPEIYPEEWSALIERQAFHYGKHEKLTRLPFQPPEYGILIEKSYRKKYDDHLVKGIIHLVERREFGPLHVFYIRFLLGIYSVQKDQIPEYFLNAVLANLHVKPGEAGYVPLKIRYMLYLYYIARDDWNNLSFVFERLGRYNTRMIPSLYYARALFKRKDYAKAWNKINALVQGNDKNLLLMNEAAVYAYHNGLFDEAENIFLRLRENFPDNREVIHNESLYLQYKARHLAELEKAG